MSPLFGRGGKHRKGQGAKDKQDTPASYAATLSVQVSKDIARIEVRRTTTNDVMATPDATCDYAVFSNNRGLLAVWTPQDETKARYGIWYTAVQAPTATKALKMLNKLAGQNSYPVVSSELETSVEVVVRPFGRSKRVTFGTNIRWPS